MDYETTVYGEISYYVGRMVEMYLLTPEEDYDREYGEYWIKWLLNASEEDLTY